MTKVVELIQDGNFILANFDGYKLSLDPVPILRQDLIFSPLTALPSAEQYSFLHVELFSLQNLLVVDPWARTQSFFINRLGEIVRCAYDCCKGRPEQQQVVYRFKIGVFDDGRRKGDYNYSFRFLSEKFCLACDGVKSIFLLETGDRSKANEWKLLATSRVVGVSLPEDEQNYIIYDARLDTVQERKQISIILGHVQHVESPLAGHASNHFLYLHWSKLTLEDAIWTFQILDTLDGKGSLYYCAFEPRADSVIISSNYIFKWRSQNLTENYLHKETEYNDKPQLHKVHKRFSWTQTDDDLKVKFKVKPNRSDFNVNCLTNRISVKYKEQMLLDGELFEKIDQDLTTWTIESNILQIKLTKSIPGLFWTTLLATASAPEEDNDKCKGNCFQTEQKPIVNLEAPIEDCDFPISLTEEEVTICK